MGLTSSRAAWERAVLRDQRVLPAIVVHELIHVNQHPPSSDRTLLAAAILESSADFLSELLVGRNINEDVHEWAASRGASLGTSMSPQVTLLRTTI